MSFPKSIPRSVWALGLVSMFMDISSEMVHGVLPLFLVSVGATTVAIGVIEGVGEGLALVTKVFSGTVSDWLGRRKVIIVAGYLLATLTKPLFAVAQGAGLVLAARSLDRFGKGLRGAPRDALVADLTPAGQRGAAYGLRHPWIRWARWSGRLHPVERYRQQLPCRLLAGLAPRRRCRRRAAALCWRAGPFGSRPVATAGARP
ncbi:MAG: hypothetical protein OEV91_10490 [Desulfobulbaceae bacterium]|nr:hypothetical protein [Desulfobulbaceae bacterium]